MTWKKPKWIGKAVSITLTIALCGGILLGLLTIAENDKHLVPEDDTMRESFTLDRVELGETAFETIAENDDFALLADRNTGEVALYDYTTDYTWFSNPQNRAEDPLAYDQTVLASQLLLNYLTIESNIESQVGTVFGSAQVDGMTSELVDNGITFTFDFPELGFTVPLTYRLHEDGFSAEIDAASIQESMAAQYKLMSIDVLPFFGAGDSMDDGYLFVPDGSGALIRYNNGRETSKAYSAPIYGHDAIIEQESQTGISQTVHMPVFGSKQNDSATFAVITSGESMGQICASVSGQKNSYNQVYPQMLYRRCEVATVNKGSKTFKMSMYTDCLLESEPFTVRYFLLYGDDADYSGMARRYRQYLTDNDMLHVSPLVGDTSLVVDLYNAVHKSENEFSIQAASTLPLTTYAQTVALHEKLKAAGVNTILNLKGWNEGGVGGASPDTHSPEKVLGGDKAFRDLCSYLNQNQVTAFFEQDFLNLYSDSRVYTGNRDGIKRMVGAAAYQYRYNYDDYQINPSSLWYLLTPNCVQDAVQRFISAFKNSDIRNVSAIGLGTQLFSDYNPNAYATRPETQKRFTKNLSTLSEAFDNVLLSDANAYAFGAASLITDTPMSSSNYDICDEAVPFYQMVLHGAVPMTLPSGNLSPNNHYVYLKAIETGCNLKYSWIADDPKVLVDTDYNNLFGVGFGEWLDEAVSQYQNIKKDMAAFAKQQIVRHETVEPNVYKTTYDSGAFVVVNYNEYEVEYEGSAIAAQNYSIFAKEGE